MEEFKDNYRIDADGFVHRSDEWNNETETRNISNNVKQQQSVNSDAAVDVFIIYEAHDQRFARFLAAELRRQQLAVVDESTSQDFARIEKAKCVVGLLSNSFLLSKRKVDELSVSLTRRRSHRPVYFIGVEQLLSAKTPTYVVLTHCAVCLYDTFWKDMILANNINKFSKEINSIRLKIESQYGELIDSDILALLKVSCDVERICRSDRFCSFSFCLAMFCCSLARNS